MTSEGQPSNSRARCQLRAEFDFSPTLPGTTTPNPALGRLTRLEDLSQP